MLAPFPRNPTWSSLAYKASAVASGSKGAFVNSLRCYKRLTNVSLATGDRHARTHTCHRWPVCCCYPVVKELGTQRRCASSLLNSTNKKARMLARSGPWATQRRRRLRAKTSTRIERVRIKIHWLLMLERISAHLPKGKRTQARRGKLP